MSPRLASLIAIAAAVLSTIALSITVTGEDGHVRVRISPSDTKGVVITLGKKASPSEPVVVADKDQQVDVEQAQAAADPDLAAEGPGIHEDAKDETPPGAPADAPQRVLEADVAGIGAPKPAVGAQNYACRQHFVQNYSDRAAGAKVEMFVLHVAVARPGALPAIWRLFDTPSFGASSHLGLEPDGTCEQWVPWAKKAWTQGAFNSVSESVEIMAMGTEGRSWWLAQPIFTKGILASIVADRLRARGLPPRLVNPDGCTPVAGYTDHERLECGNTHVDVGRGFPWDVFHQQVRRAYYGAAPPRPPLPACTTRNVQRRLNAHPAGHHWAHPPRPPLPVDGRYGARTRAQVVRFQRAHGLDSDGIVGPRTGAALRLAGCRA